VITIISNILTTINNAMKNRPILDDTIINPKSGKEEVIILDEKKAIKEIDEKIEQKRTRKRIKIDLKHYQEVIEEKKNTKKCEENIEQKERKRKKKRLERDISYPDIMK